MDREALGRLVRDEWIAWARENPVPCGACEGRGVRERPCHRCADSTDDHECPGPVPCFACGGAGKVVKASWVAPWEDLAEPDREVDRRIGERLARAAGATLATLQADLAARWGTQEYNAAFQARVAAGDPLVRVDHDFKHLLGSLGALAKLAEECDHADPVPHADAARAVVLNKYADTLIVLLGLANHWPGGAIDAQAAVAARVAEKFPPAPTAADQPHLAELPDDLVARLAWRAGDRSGAQPTVDMRTATAWNWTTDSPTGCVVVARATASEHGSAGRRWPDAAFAAEHARRQPAGPAAPGEGG